MLLKAGAAVDLSNSHGETPLHIATDEDDIDNDQRKTSAPVQVKQVQPMLDIARLETRLTACTTIDELGKVYMSFTASEKQATETLKNQLKEKLTPAK